CVLLQEDRQGPTKHIFRAYGGGRNMQFPPLLRHWSAVFAGRDPKFGFFNGRLKLPAAAGSADLCEYSAHDPQDEFTGTINGVNTCSFAMCSWSDFLDLAIEFHLQVTFD